MAGVTGERVVPEDTYFLEEVDVLFVAAVFPFREEELLVVFRSEEHTSELQSLV